MEHINNQEYFHSIIIDYIIDTNKDTNNHFFYQEKEIIKNWLQQIDRKLFLKTLVIFNFHSYSGYFALLMKKQLKEAVLTENYENFKSLVNNYNDSYLEEEIMSHNLWMARMIYGCAKCEIKYLINARKSFHQEDDIINFKNKIRRDGKVYDLRVFLDAVMKNKIIMKEDEKKWLFDRYDKEVQIIKHYLELELASEIGDKGVEY